MRWWLFFILNYSVAGYSALNDTLILLKPYIENDNEYLTLKDIFMGDPAEISSLDNSRVLLKMPACGQQIILKSEDIQKFLSAYEITAPVILRDVIIISKFPNHQPPMTEDMFLKNFLNAYLEKTYHHDQWQITIEENSETQQWNQYFLQQAVVETAQLTGSNFTCVIALLATGKKIKIKALVQRLSKIPLLNRLILPNESIKPEDLQWGTLLTEKISAIYALKEQEIIGYTPSGQPLQPGEPIKKAALKKINVVHKGDLVTLVLQTPYMVLTQRKAQALEDGGLGDRIKVCNLDTKRLLMGIVKDNALIEIPYGTY